MLCFAIDILWWYGFYTVEDIMTACYIAGFNLITIAFCVSQLILRVGSCDVDDMILNTLGGCIGYGIYRLVFRKKEKGIYEETI